MLYATETDTTVYQLITSPAVLKSENNAYNTVYSILFVKLSGGAAETTLVYDIARTKSKGIKILSEVIRCAPSPNDIHDFIAEML